MRICCPLQVFDKNKWQCVPVKVKNPNIMSSEFPIVMTYMYVVVPGLLPAILIFFLSLPLQVTASSGIRTNSRLLANRGPPPAAGAVQPQFGKPQTALPQRVLDVSNFVQRPAVSGIPCNKGPRWLPATSQIQGRP